jgi:hypothetical protein
VGVAAWFADWLVDVLLCLALLLAAVAGGLLRGKRYEPPAPEAVTLQKLSYGWTKEGETIHISELVHYWRNDQLHEKEDDSIALNHPRAAAFLEQLRQWAFFKKFLQQRVVCEQILQLLDREGDCPSVVNVKGDVEGAWDENTYSILAQTSLLNHSLNVAEQVVRLLSEDQAWHVIPDTMVAALGHDLGKLKAQAGSLYTMGEHPLAASKPLAGIPRFNKLHRKEEILRAIRLHHKMPEGLLGKTLKKADQLARQKELEETVQSHAVESIKENAPASDPPHKTMNENTEPLPKTSFNPVIADPAKAAWQAQVDIYGEKPSAQKQPATEPPQLLDISRWFDGGGFLNELKPYINKMFGRQFLAFSMPDGLIYFQVKVLEDVARKQAERAGCMEIATMDQKDLTMRHVLFTIVHRLRAEQDVIAGDLIKETYFGGYFLVARKFGKDLKGYYTPFHAEAFGSIAEMEHAKPDMLRDIVKVTPFLDSGDQEI